MVYIKIELSDRKTVKGVTVEHIDVMEEHTSHGESLWDIQNFFIDILEVMKSKRFTDRKNIYTDYEYKFQEVKKSD